jgi:hypothetical protein
MLDMPALQAEVAIDGNIAVAGAPNRELLSINSGAALIYDVSFLNLNFRDGPYTLTEGGEVDENSCCRRMKEKMNTSIRRR